VKHNIFGQLAFLRYFKTRPIHRSYKGLRSSREMTIELTVSDIAIVQQFQESPYRIRIGLRISCSALGRRWTHYPTYISNICWHLLPFLPNVEQLDIKAAFCSACSASRAYEGMVDAMQWLELFRSFAGVKALGVSGVCTKH